jgi:hypothetical protein
MLCSAMVISLDDKTDVLIVLFDPGVNEMPMFSSQGHP